MDRHNYICLKKQCYCKKILLLNQCFIEDILKTVREKQLKYVNGWLDQLCIVRLYGSSPNYYLDQGFSYNSWKYLVHCLAKKLHVAGCKCPKAIILYYFVVAVSF